MELVNRLLWMSILNYAIAALQILLVVAIVPSLNFAAILLCVMAGTFVHRAYAASCAYYTLKKKEET